VTATDGESGLRRLREDAPDLMILDLMLPRLNGYELCKRARAEGIAIPVLMLTARGEEADRVRGLDLGADDYVTKPFSLPELLARVRALLRRGPTKTGIGLVRELRVGEIEVDFQKFEARVASRAVELTRKEFGILRVLVSHAGQAMTRDELLDAVWGEETYVSPRTVDNHVLTLRSKLGLRNLVTVHGVGYKWSLTNT